MYDERILKIRLKFLVEVYFVIKISSIREKGKYSHERHCDIKITNVSIFVFILS